MEAAAPPDVPARERPSPSAAGLAAGSLLWLAGIAVLATFPFASAPLLAGAMLYTGLLLRFPGAALVAVPLLLPLLYLSPWSGRIHLDAFDALLAITVGVALARGRWAWSFRSMGPSARLTLLAFLLVYAIALLRGLLPLPEVTPNAFATYYGELNSLRIAKGLLWALLLYPVWVAERRLDAQRARRRLTLGIALGAFAVALVVLWERQVFQSILFWTNRWAPLHALLDFTTRYRVTALFADMHTGGTAIDGYLLLVTPFAAALLFRARSTAMMLLGAAALAGILYASVVTFSRGVYLGLAAAMAATAALLLRQRREGSTHRTAALLVGGLGAAVAASAIGFRTGGFPALAYVVLALLLGSWAAHGARGARRRLILGGSAFLGLALVTAATASVSARPYLPVGVPPVVVAGAVVLLGLEGGRALGSALPAILGFRQTIVALAAAGVLLPLVTAGALGYGMSARFSEAMDDLQVRLNHWETAIRIMDDDPVTRLFGEGLGSFPRLYYWRHQQLSGAGAGGFTFQQEAGNTYLRLVSDHSFRIGQRVALEPGEDHVLSLRVRSADPRAVLYIRVCHRYLIHPTEWNPNCVAFRQHVEGGDNSWTTLELPFHSGDLGSLRKRLHAPLVLTVANRGGEPLEGQPRTVLDVDDISIAGPALGERVRNGDFSDGVDRWLGYYDQDHLPWHIKNLWIHVYFETGAAGLVLFVLLLTQALLATARRAGDEPLAFPVFVALAGFATVGTFGTLLDAPRTAMLFYLLLLIGLAMGRLPRPGPSEVAS